MSDRYTWGTSWFFFSVPVHWKHVDLFLKICASNLDFFFFIIFPFIRKLKMTIPYSTRMPNDHRELFYEFRMHRVFGSLYTERERRQYFSTIIKQTVTRAQTEIKHGNNSISGSIKGRIISNFTMVYNYVRQLNCVFNLLPV